MGIRSWIEKRWLNGDSAENQGSWWSTFVSGSNNMAGTNISEHNALRITTVFACVRIIAETISSLPLNVYKKDSKGTKAKAYDHPLYRVLHDEANDDMTAFAFWEATVGHLLTWGNSYAEIERNGRGYVVALWPITPDRVRVDYKAGKLVYRVSNGKGEDVTINPADILHFHGLGFDGRTGYSPIQMAKEALGFAKATEQYGSTFFSNGGKPSGVLEMEGILKDKAASDRLRENWEDIHGGAGKAHRVAILEANMKYKPISLPPNDAQFLETRRFQKADIAQMFRVPLHMINDLTNATFSNIEHQSIEFVVHTIRPYLVRMEQEIRRKLFVTPADKQYYAEWLVDGLLRGDAKSRNEALQIQRQNGIINANEWREIENMNPQEGKQGDAYLVNSAMIAVDQALLPKETTPKGGEPNGKGTKEPDGSS